MTFIRFSLTVCIEHKINCIVNISIRPYFHSIPVVNMTNLTSSKATATNGRNIQILLFNILACWISSNLHRKLGRKKFPFLNINQFGYKCSFDLRSEPAATHKGENAHKITFHASKKLNKSKNKTSLQETRNENENKTWKKFGSDVSMHFATFHRPPSVHNFLPKLDK